MEARTAAHQPSREPVGGGGSLGIVVVGGGVSGSTCALELANAGHRVEVRARELGRETTSAVAAALWHPYAVEPADRAAPWALESHARFERLADDPETGVRMTEGLEVLRPGAGLPAWLEPLGGRPVEHESGARAWRYRAPVVEMPRYLGWLEARLRELGVPLRRMRVTDLATLFAEADLVVDCAGLGARDLAADDGVFPARGQLVHVARESPASGEPIDRFVFDETDEVVTYVVPRSDDVVLGGSYEPHEVGLEPDGSTTSAIRARCERLVPALRGARLLGESVGLRPCRASVRLELEETPAGPVVHDYGHGGAGVTLSWGCAVEVARLVRERAARS